MLYDVGMNNPRSISEWPLPAGGYIGSPLCDGPRRSNGWHGDPVTNGEGYVNAVWTPNVARTLHLAADLDLIILVVRQWVIPSALLQWFTTETAGPDSIPLSPTFRRLIADSMEPNSPLSLLKSLELPEPPPSLDAAVDKAIGESTSEWVVVTPQKAGGQRMTTPLVEMKQGELVFIKDGDCSKVTTDDVVQTSRQDGAEILGLSKHSPLPSPLLATVLAALRLSPAPHSARSVAACCGVRDLSSVQTVLDEALALGLVVALEYTIFCPINFEPTVGYQHVDGLWIHHPLVVESCVGDWGAGFSSRGWHEDGPMIAAVKAYIERPTTGPGGVVVQHMMMGRLEVQRVWLVARGVKGFHDHYHLSECGARGAVQMTLATAVGAWEEPTVKVWG